jgi:hypothetical protein
VTIARPLKKPEPRGRNAYINMDMSQDLPVWAELSFNFGQRKRCQLPATDQVVKLCLDYTWPRLPVLDLTAHLARLHRPHSTSLPTRNQNRTRNSPYWGADGSNLENCCRLRHCQHASRRLNHGGSTCHHRPNWHDRGGQDHLCLASIRAEARNWSRCRLLYLLTPGNQILLEGAKPMMTWTNKKLTHLFPLS